ncbi:MAG TPA: UDP-N-acetylglucosamine--N-acetylmuramyl-(pentapeptide) pyrophosphoryl-undecaprenol N-acetylglucosamine transferase, partial [Acidimicrobiales bacterium]|nr:UDP-N-acetylglucosamine--N-acetylmuramyl-(pentapeptide) pyrophosphoryl-undecaprenol N-acetylglucosamine transferase [Acidimicrobiales bacterium]
MSARSAGRHSRRCYALVAGGGTAGHVQPAIAIARALVRRGHRQSSVELVGSERGIETRLVPEAGFDLTVLPGRGIQRKVSWQNVRSAGALLVALRRAWRLVGDRRPRVVVSVGGYASVPCALAALVRRVPVVVAEQNAAPGAANRLVSRWAKACAVSFPDTPLPKAVVTGNPVRPEVLAIDRSRDAAPARTKLGVEPGRRLVLIFGGSLGALRINRAAVEAVQLWVGRGDLHVRHVIGSRDWGELTASSPVPPGSPLRYDAIEYDDDMPTSLAAADLVVCRSGASTSFELLAAGLPAILVPSPFVTADHQAANARHLERAGAAVVVPDAELDGVRLTAEVDALLADPHRLAAMA